VSTAVNPNARPAWMGKPKPAMSALKALTVAVVCVVIGVPFWLIIATSLSPDEQVVANGGWSMWPRHLDFGAYTRRSTAARSSTRSSPR